MNEQECPYCKYPYRPHKAHKHLYKPHIRVDNKYKLKECPLCKGKTLLFEITRWGDCDDWHLKLRCPNCGVRLKRFYTDVSSLEAVGTLVREWNQREEDRS